MDTQKYLLTQGSTSSGPSFCMPFPRCLLRWSILCSPLLQVFNNWMDQTLDDLNETFVCSTIADVEQLQHEHEEYKAGDLQKGDTDYSELNALVEQMAQLGATDNPYTTLTAQVSGL